MTDTEALLVKLCAVKLKLEMIDPTDDLMQLGADSLFLMELAAEIEDAFDIDVPAEALEIDTHVYRIAMWIDARRAGS